MLLYADLFDHLAQGGGVRSNSSGYVDTSWLTRQVFPGNVVLYGTLTYPNSNYNHDGLSLDPGAVDGNCLTCYRDTGTLGNSGFVTLQMSLLTVNKTAKHYFSFRARRGGGVSDETLFAINDGFYFDDVAPTSSMKVLYVKADGTLSLGGVDSSASVISNAVYSLIEIEIDPVADIINVYVEKNLEITKTGSGWFSNGLDRLGIMYWNSESLGSGSYVGMSFDDVLCWDYTGTGKFSSYPTEILRVTATPIMTTGSDQWDSVGGAASKIDALTDKNMSGEFNLSTYASAHEPGLKDTFGIDSSGITGTPLAVVCVPLISQNALRQTPFAAIQFEDSTASESQDIEWQNAGGTPGCAPIPFHIEQAPSGGALDLSALKVGYKTNV